MEEQKMTAIIVRLRAGRTAREIAEFNKLPRSLCYRIKKGFYDCIAVGEDLDDVSVDRKTHKNRRDAIMTPEFVDKLQNMIGEDFEQDLRVTVDGLRVSADAYIHVMDTVVKSCMGALLETVITRSNRTVHLPTMLTRRRHGWRRT